MGYARHLDGFQSPLWGGSFAMESVAGFVRNQWQLCRGMTGNFGMESVAGFAWNQWQACRGIGGSFRAEYAVTLHTWTEVQGLKKENYYITGEPGTPIPSWFRTILRKKQLSDIVHFPHCPSRFYD